MALFSPATREKTFLKLCLAGPAGSGKSYTLLRLAHAMLAAGLGKRFAVIETEAGKIKKYVGYVVDNHRWAFDVAVLTSFGPQEYIAAIEEAVRSGYDLIGIDSLSHEWQGAGGALEIVDKLSDRNKFAGWKEVTPLHTRFIEAILRAPAHIIATVRLKMDYVLVEEEKNGKKVQVPRKVGLAPVQRNGLEYEFEIFCTMDESHILKVEKTICPTIDGKTCIEPGEAFFRPVFDWLSTGEDIRIESFQTYTAPPEDLARAVGRLSAAGCAIEPEKEWVLKTFGVRELGHLSREQFTRWLARVEIVVHNATQGAAPPVASATPSQQPQPVAAPSVSQPAAPANGTPAPTNGNGTLAPAAPASPAAPPKSLSGDVKTDCVQLWEEFCNLKRWSRDDMDAAWKVAVLDKYAVSHARELRTDQMIELREKLIDVVRRTYQEAGLAGACPF